MKYKSFFVALILIPLAIIFGSCHLCENDDIKNPPPRDLSIAEQGIVSADNVFGLKLFKALHTAKPESNLFISPLSISMALGMTLNGANGDTYEAMKTTLELNGLSETEINESYKNLIGLLTNLDEEVIFNIANSIWYRNEFSIEQSFIDVNKEYFDAEVRGLDFCNPSSLNIINNWVDQKTNGLIKKILEEQIPDYMVMYLINAIYFKGVWTNEFDKKETKTEPFYNYNNAVSNISLMHQEDDFFYAENDQFQAVDLIYGDSLFSMTIILPKENIDINNLVQSADNSFIPDQFISAELNLYLPKFELEWKSSLNDVLKSMGMEIAFNTALADFTKINPDGNLFIDEVLHKTIIKVDEEGTEAAAVTSVGIGLTARPETIDFRVDRPFIFLVREKHSETILFIGKVLEI
ncbi:serpin family protein [Candidatus Neomarinimicrobiota bacterium]